MSMQLLWDGLKAMVLGMSMVYLFLVFMILIMNWTSKLLKPYAGFLEPAAKPKTGRAQAAAGVSGIAGDKLANIAAMAVAAYRKDNKTGLSGIVNVPFDGKNVSVEVAPEGCAPSASASAAPAAVHSPAPAAATGVKEIISPLPGTIIKVCVEVGEDIAAGGVLAVIEAMKMETEIKAECAGRVKDILVSPKEIVASEQTLLLLEVVK